MISPKLKKNEATIRRRLIYHDFSDISGSIFFRTGTQQSYRLYTIGRPGPMFCRLRTLSCSQPNFQARSRRGKQGLITLIFCPCSVKFEQNPLFYPRGCAAPLRGITPIATLERFVVYCPCEQNISAAPPGVAHRARGIAQAVTSPSSWFSAGGPGVDLASASRAFFMPVLPTNRTS